MVHGTSLAMAYSDPCPPGANRFCGGAGSFLCPEPIRSVSDGHRSQQGRRVALDARSASAKATVPSPSALAMRTAACFAQPV